MIMADRYWVGGDGVWNTTNTANWSDTSGGTGGASVPTAADTVFFDTAMVKTTVVTIGANVVCGGMMIAPSTGALDFFLYREGDFTITCTGDIWSMMRNSSITLLEVIVAPTTSTATLIFSTEWAFGIITLDVTNNKIDVALPAAAAAAGSILTCNIKGNSPNYVQFIGGSSALRDVSISGSPIVSFAMTELKSITVTGTPYISGSIYIAPTWGSVDLASTGKYLDLDILLQGGTTTFNGSPTVNTIAVVSNTTVATALRFSTNSFYKVYGLSVDGNETRNVLIRSTVSGTRAQISYLGAAKTINYVNVQDIHIVEDDKIISNTTNSTNLGNNWQWYFDNYTKPVRNLFFGSHV